VHGEDPLQVAAELQLVIDEWEVIHAQDSRPPPPALIRPMMEYV